MIAARTMIAALALVLARARGDDGCDDARRSKGAYRQTRPSPPAWGSSFVCEPPRCVRETFRTHRRLAAPCGAEAAQPPPARCGAGARGDAFAACAAFWAREPCAACDPGGWNATRPDWWAGACAATPTLGLVFISETGGDGVVRSGLVGGWMRNFRPFQNDPRGGSPIGCKMVHHTPPRHLPEPFRGARDTFCFVRDPLDRWLATFARKQRRGDAGAETRAALRDWSRAMLDLLEAGDVAANPLEDCAFIPQEQYVFFADDGPQRACRHVLDYDHYAAELAQLEAPCAATRGARLEDPTALNASHLDAGLRDRVRRLYRRDYERLGAYLGRGPPAAEPERRAWFDGVSRTFDEFGSLGFDAAGTLRAWRAAGAVAR